MRPTYVARKQLDLLVAVSIETHVSPRDCIRISSKKSTVVIDVAVYL